MDWLQFIDKELIRSNDGKFGFNEPVTEGTLTELKEQFGLTQLPEELEALYRQTNGVNDFVYIASVNEFILSEEFIWSVERIIETNTFKRTSDTYKEIYKSFNNLFFFADSGGGDHFGFETVNGRFERPHVYFWDHEDDRRVWVAPNMKAFIEGWVNGTIKV
jgi:hypothetical protein